MTSVRTLFILMQIIGRTAHTAPVGGFVDVATSEHWCLWVGAQRDCARNDSGRRVVVLEMGGEDPFRPHALLDPIN